MRAQKQKPGAQVATGSDCKAGRLRDQNNPKRQSAQQRWRQRNPVAYLAHLTVQNALRLGVIERQPCEVCGAEKTDAHHLDYGQPLLVQWLCRKHHKQEHKRLRAAK